MSSSVLAFSCETDGRIQIGGVGTYCHKNISGRPSAGLRPKSSQSFGVIILNRFRTRNGFKSSMALRTCLSTSALCFLASAKELSQSFLPGGGTFFADMDLLKAWNLSC